MTEEQETVPVYMVKLITGELLISEAYIDDKDEDEILQLVHPITVQSDTSHGGRFSLGEWIIPFLLKPEVNIFLSDIILMEPVSDDHIKMYGSFLTQIMINKIKMETIDEMNPSTQYYDVMTAVEKMKSVSKKMSEKFNTPELDVSDFEEGTKNIKPPPMH